TPSEPSALVSKKNSTQNNTLEDTAPKLIQFDAPAIKSVVIHIPRQRRQEWEPYLPFNFLYTHSPCDFDAAPVVHGSLGERGCLWLYSQRFASEGFYRIFSLLRLEGFFFGMYLERLFRYEYDIHYFDY
ncbi:hypothetical protein KR067_003218, partial [Drosophila pandora]